MQHWEEVLNTSERMISSRSTKTLEMACLVQTTPVRWDYLYHFAIFPFMYVTEIMHTCFFFLKKSHVQQKSIILM